MRSPVALSRRLPSAGLACLVVALLQACTSASAPGGPAMAGPAERVRVPSLAGVVLDGYLFRPAEPGRRPALVFLHGCSGLVGADGRIRSREVDWAERLTARGYVVLMIDSFSPRARGGMCRSGTFEPAVYLERPKDAYGALRYLQDQDYVRPDRVGVMGWSQGGGALLLSIRADSLGRPGDLPRGDFRAAVAFYPASCREGAHRLPWTSAIPLLVLIGAEDNWTPAAPCRQLAERAVGRGSPVEIHVYPGAYHDFDWPGLPVRQQPAFQTAAGVVPVTGMDPSAREDALRRVPEFLASHLR